MAARSALLALGVVAAVALLAHAPAAQSMRRLVITDDPEEAARIATETGLSQFGLTYGPQAEPNRLLLERAIVDRR